jgi:ATP-dependent DNA helicase RecQ
VGFGGDAYPVALLTPEGRRVMTGERPARVLLPRHHEPSSAAPRRARTRVSDRAVAAESEAAWGEREEALFQELRACRQELARRAGKPAYVIAHDRTLRDLARLRPGSRDALADAHGLGPAKIARYGEAFLAVIARCA